MQNFVLTSESVTAGHPDKLCDQICDAVVDQTLGEQAPAPVAAECAIANGIVFLSVGRSGSSGLDLAETARGVIADAGYLTGLFGKDTHYRPIEKYGFDRVEPIHGCNRCSETCPVDIKVWEDPNSSSCVRCLNCLKCDHVKLELGGLSEKVRVTR